MLTLTCCLLSSASVFTFFLLSPCLLALLLLLDILVLTIPLLCSTKLLRLFFKAAPEVLLPCLLLLSSFLGLFSLFLHSAELF